MTEERLQKIIDEISDNGTRIMRPNMVMKAMKQAVNEALDEAADEVDFTEATYVTAHAGSTHEIDKQSILNLKVI